MRAFFLVHSVAVAAFQFWEFVAVDFEVSVHVAHHCYFASLHLRVDFYHGNSNIAKCPTSEGEKNDDRGCRDVSGLTTSY